MKDGSDKEIQKKGERTQANGKLLRCDRSQPIMSPGEPMASNQQRKFNYSAGFCVEQSQRNKLKSGINYALNNKFGLTWLTSCIDSSLG